MCSWRWDSEVDRGGGRAVVDLRELVVGAAEADLEPFDFAEPALALSLSDAGDEIVADFRDARPLSWIGPVHGAPEARVFMNAWGGVGASAQPCGDLPAFEVAEELFPFLVGGVSVFLGGA